jgi:uncharacterized delta-60 repeat protein
MRLKIHTLLGLVFTLLTNPAAAPRPTFVDPAFAPALTERITYPVLAWTRPNGKIVISGDWLASVNGVVIPKLAQLNSDGSLDTTFRAPGDTWKATALDFVGDQIVFASAWRIRRLYPNGAPDESFFAQAESFSGSQVIYNLLAQPDASVFITASMMNNVFHFDSAPIFKLTPTGTIDQSFNALAVSGGGVAASLANGKLIVTLQVYDTNRVARAKLLRLRPDGSTDETFSSPFLTNEIQNAYLDGFALQNDGKILASGNFTFAGDKSRRGMARFHADGSLDESFDPGTGFDYVDPYRPSDNIVAIASISVADTGQIYVSGRFTAYNGAARTNFVRLFSNGALDPAFISGLAAETNNAYQFPLSSQIQSDGKILVSQNKPYSGSIPGRLARLNSDGSIDTTFQPNLGSPSLVSAICVGATRTYAAGWFEQINGVPRKFFGALSFDGKLDPAFSEVPLDRPPSVIVETADGKILLGGSFNYVHGAARIGLARLNADGSLDNSFDANLASVAVAALAIETSGKILVGGNFGGSFGVARLQPNGPIDRKFSISAATAITAIAALDNGKFFVAGDTLTISNQTRKGLARLNPDGALDSTFTPDFSLSNQFDKPGKVEAIAPLSDGRIYAGGGMTNAAYPNQFLALVRLMPDGSIDPSFGPVTSTGFSRYSNPGIHFAFLPDNSIMLVGGVFPNRPGIARLYANGVLDTNFDLSLTGSLADIRLDPNGGLLVAGSITSADGFPRSGLIRLLPNPIPHPEGRALKLLGGRFDVEGYQMLLKGMTHYRANIEWSTDLKTWLAIDQTGLSRQPEELITVRLAPTGPPKFFRAVEVP